MEIIAQAVAAKLAEDGLNIDQATPEVIAAYLAAVAKKQTEMAMAYVTATPEQRRPVDTQVIAGLKA